jgi:hypothetical protein
MQFEDYLAIMDKRAIDPEQRVIIDGKSVRVLGSKSIRRKFTNADIKTRTAKSTRPKRRNGRRTTPIR